MARGSSAADRIVINHELAQHSRLLWSGLRFMTGDTEKGRKAAVRAQALVTEALDLLDAHVGTTEAAVHLELALQELRRITGKRP